MGKARVLVLATQNEAKVRELTALLADMPFKVRTAREEGFLKDIAETGTTFASNAVLKAETICGALNCWAIADDSGIAVDYLNGAPGVHSARYSGANASDLGNNAKLLAALRGVEPVHRTARFISVVALSRPGLPTVCFEGICEGEVLFVPRGQAGFGYDPIFLPQGEILSYAELSEERKNEMSHRGRAMRRFLEFFRNLPVENA